VRVLFVYRYLTLGGVEAVLRARLEGLPALGVEAQAWFLSDGGGRTMFAGMEDRVHVGGIEALEAFLEAEPQDVVSVIDTPEALPGLPASRSARLVVEGHSPYLENLEYLRSLDPRRVAAFWVPSAYQRLVVMKRLGREVEVRVVPNPLGDVFLQPLRPFTPRPPRPIVAWVGRLDRLKNWKGFIAIAARVDQSIPDVEFWLAGDTVEDNGVDDLFRAAQKAGIAGKLFWFRSLPHRRAPAWLDAVRESGGLVISTSRNESFGMAIAEAMARACPVVVPALGPFPEIVTHSESGLLYRAGSGAAAAAEGLSFLRDPALRRYCGERARGSIRSRHAAQKALGETADAICETYHA
jgi:glycosyltransferase involved in cell wall biosynthesis